MAHLISYLFIFLASATASASPETEYANKINSVNSAQIFFEKEMMFLGSQDKAFFLKKLKEIEPTLWPKATIKGGKIWLHFKQDFIHLEISKNRKQIIINGIVKAIPSKASVESIHTIILDALSPKSTYWQNAFFIQEAHAVLPVWAAYAAITAFLGSSYWVYSDVASTCKEVVTLNGQCEGKLRKAKFFLEQFHRFSGKIKLTTQGKKDFAKKTIPCPKDLRDAGEKYLEDSEDTDTYYSDHTDYVVELKELLGELRSHMADGLLDGGAINKTAKLMCAKPKERLVECEKAIVKYLKSVCEKADPEDSEAQLESAPVQK